MRSGYWAVRKSSSGVSLNSCHGICDCTLSASCTLDIAASCGDWDSVLARFSGQYAESSSSESSKYTRVESESWVAVRMSKTRRYPPFAAQPGGVDSVRTLNYVGSCFVRRP